MKPRCSTCEIMNKASMVWAATLLPWLVISPYTWILSALALAVFMLGIVICRMDCCD